MQYPRDNPLYDDAAMLRSAVTFSIGQRAYEAESLLREPLDSFSLEGLADRIVAAFEAEMSATEDMLGWVLVLRDWQPGTAEYSLVRLLNTVDLGRPNTRYSEEAVEEFLASLDDEGVRTLLHLPTDAELEVAGLSAELRAKIRASLPQHRSGLILTARQRSEHSRTRVAVFNRLKHVITAHRVINPRGQPVVMLFAMGLQSDGWPTRRLDLVISEANIRAMAGRAIAAEATLYSILNLILLTRYGEEHPTPAWAGRASALGVWATSVDEQATERATE